MVAYSLKNMSSRPALLTTQQVAKLLGYTLQHVRLLIRQGKLSAFKLGRDWVIRNDEVERFRVPRRKSLLLAVPVHDRSY